MQSKLVTNLFLFISAMIFFPILLLSTNKIPESYLFKQIIIYLVLIVIYILFLWCLFNQFNKPPRYKKTFLYSWLDNLSDYDELLMHSLRLQRARFGTLDNLNDTKDWLFKQTSKNKSTLKMYRMFYNQKLKGTEQDFYIKAILLIIPAVIALFGTSIVALDSSQIMFIGSVLIILLVFLSIVQGAGKRRYSILIELIDICIEEIEIEKNINY